MHDRWFPVSVGILAALVVGGMAAGQAEAANVTTSISARETYVGIPVTLQIKIENARDHEPPVLPDIPEVQVRSAGTPSQSSQTTIINGVMSRSVTITYAYSVTPKKPGQFTIPALKVKADGKEHATQPITIVVSKSETGDLLFVEVQGSRDSLYVGESLNVALNIWLKPYYDRQYRRKLSEGEMWSLIDLEKSEWGVFLDPLKEMLAHRRRPGGQEQLRKDAQGSEHAYYVYQIERTFWPERAGPLDVGEVRVLVSYPTRLAVGQAPFSFGQQLRIADARPVSASVPLGQTQVKPVPAQGRPPYYRGAVGQYQISATAKPTEVAVGDPLTLTLTIKGTGRLDQLQAPPLAEMTDLLRDFKIPPDPLAGEVAGDSKRFGQTLRATSDAVRQIPPIPFVYFDPQQERFVTVQTEPIPVTVKPADKLSMTQIVDVTGGGGSPAVRQLTEAAGGILANYTGMDEILSQQAWTPGWFALVMLGAPPLLFVICWFTRNYRHRLEHDVSYARRRSAKHQAMARIRQVRRAGGPEQVSALMAAITGYVADRCNLPTGGLTRDVVVAHLTEHQVAPDVVRQVDHLLQRCENLQYGGADRAATGELVELAMRCIKNLERQRF